MQTPLSFVHRSFTFKVLEALLNEATTTALKRDSSFAPVRGRLLYVAQSCQPWDNNGYTVRTHELLTVLNNSGADIHVVTRTGYPWDRHKDAGISDIHGTHVGVLTYIHLPKPANTCLTALYAKRAVPVLEAYARKIRPACIQAASNHVNALPALLAARRLGIPFQYEMRGLWELSRLAHNPKYKNSHTFQLGLDLESFVARHADRVFVISEELAHFAKTQWDISKKKLFLLPNCVDTSRFRPNVLLTTLSDQTDSQNDRHPLLLGYAGSLLDYEGLDVLLHALRIVLNSSTYRALPSPVHLEIVGDGEAREHLTTLVGQLHLEGIVTFLGRRFHDEVRQKLATWSAVCLPRKPYDVCTFIPPLKLVEAMAMAKPVIVPDLALFHAETGNNGIFFEPGNPESLAQVIGSLLEHPDHLKQKAECCRAFVVRHRQWQQYFDDLLALAQ